MKTKLINLIASKKAIVGVVGLGYVGLPLMLRFVEEGFSTLGFDIDLNKVNSLNQGTSYIKHIGIERVQNAFNKKDVEATNQFQRTQEVDILIICVPTPLGKHNEPNLSFILQTIESIAPYLKSGQIVSLESTTYPGTTEEIIRPKLEEKGFEIGQDIFLIYSPEREDPGNKVFFTEKIPKLVGGSTSNCLEVGTFLYSSVLEKVVPISSTKVAEMAKLLENIYRAVNIGLVNELKILADKMEIDIWEVIDAAATKPFGFTPFYPGPGLGGHCIPIDPFYLTWKAREYGFHTRFIELAGEINTSMPQWVTDKVADALNCKKKSINGSKILIMGVSYKKNIDDLRESPALEIMNILQHKGAEISYCDPYIPSLPKTRKYDFQMSSVEISKDLLFEMDCILITTNHDDFDYHFIQKNSNLIVDTRGQYRGKYENVFSA